MKAVRILIGLLASGLVVAACGGSSDDDGGSGGGSSGATTSSGGSGGSSGSSSSSLGGSSTAHGGNSGTAQGGSETQAAGGGENAAGNGSENGGASGTARGGASARGGSTGTARGGSAAVGGDNGAGATGEPPQGGAGGAGPAAGCPDAAPKSGSACTLTTGQACDYTDANERCTCGGRLGGNRTWTCTATIACPATEPTGKCTAVAGGAVNNRCDYDAGTQCTCEAAGGTATGDAWNCVSPIMCPADAPTNGDKCTSVAGGPAFNRCTFGQTDCTCEAGIGRNATDSWNCVGPIACPATAPMTGDKCTASGGGAVNNQCDFGSTHCTCQATTIGGGGDAWDCVTPLECPATSPKTGDACTVVAGGTVNNTCSYGSSRCTCAAATRGGAASWTCN